MKIRAISTDAFGVCRPRDIFETRESLPGGISIELSERAMHTRFMGFGVALTGSSCYLLNKMDAERRKELLDDIYGEEGLGLTVARVSIGSSDYSPEIYSYEDEKGNFSIEKDEEYVLPILREVAERYGELRFFASPWSPPGRMKTGGSMCGGFMREGFVEEYADYIVKFVRAYAERGVRIDAITPQNEPETDQQGRMPACRWSPETEAKFVLALRRKADSAGLPFEIWLCDHNFAFWQRVLWQLEEFPELKECVSAVAFHYYGGGADLIEPVRERHPTLDFHFTEGGPRLYDNYATDHCKWGIAMVQALNHGCRSFTGWNLLLDESGSPNVGPFFCGGLVTENSVSGELSYSGQYRAFRHFSSYVKRGADILATRVVGEDRGLYGYPKQKPSIEVCAARNPDGRIVIELVNPDTSDKRQITLRLRDKVVYFDALPDSLNTIIIDA